MVDEPIIQSVPVAGAPRIDEIVAVPPNQFVTAAPPMLTNAPVFPELRAVINV